MTGLEDIRFAKQKGLFGTHVMRLAVDAWSSLLADNLMDSTVDCISWEDEVWVAWDGPFAVGMIGFKHQEWNKAIVIRLGYVMPSYRNRGIYAELWSLLVMDAQDRGVPRISSATNVNNHRMRQIAKVRGMREFMVTLEYDVPPGAPRG